MTTRSYEGMFLLENNAATADFDGTAAQVDAVLEKHGATLVKKEKWDERKLAYEIKGQRRATYYLVYFTVEPGALREIRTDLHLTEVLLRHMMLAIDEPIEAYVKERDEERERLAEDSRRNSLSGWGDSRRRKERRGSRDRDDRSDDRSGEGAERSGGSKPAQAPPAGDDKPEADTPKAEAKADAPKADTKASDTKASDTKASDTKASDTKASDTGASDKKPSDTKPADEKDPEAQKTEAVES